MTRAELGTPRRASDVVIGWSLLLLAHITLPSPNLFNSACRIVYEYNENELRKIFYYFVLKWFSSAFVTNIIQFLLDSKWAYYSFYDIVSDKIIETFSVNIFIVRALEVACYSNYYLFSFDIKYSSLIVFRGSNLKTLLM